MKGKKVISIAKLILRTLIGIFFIVTAVLKLMSLAQFEIYIYSFNIFNYTWSALVARAVIASEFVLGTFLIAKFYYRQTWWVTMAMLLGYSFLLLYAAIFRHDSNCHCMGELVQLTPGFSILKNLAVMLLLLLVRKENDYRYRGRMAVGSVLFLASLLVPFAFFPTDAVYQVLSKDNGSVNEEYFSAFMQDSVAQSLDLSKGNYVLGYVSAGCKYCKLGVSKVRSIVQRRQLDTAHVVFLIWGKDERIQEFKQETETPDYRYAKIGPIESIQITNGAFPTFVFVQNGKIVKIADLKGVDENFIVDFIGK